MKLSLLTWNVGVLRCAPFGQPIFEPAPFTSERFRALPKALTGADIITLQEVYGTYAQNIIAARMSASNPYCAVGQNHWWQLGSGLMILSRYPLKDIAFIPFQDNAWEERIATRRGMLIATICCPDRDVRILNTHLVAGGMYRHPESAKLEAIRAKQIEQLLDTAEDESINIIAGDLNAGPQASPANYERLLSEKIWRDAYADHTNLNEPTWDPKNPLNANGPHRMCPAQRIDHVLLNTANFRHNAIANIVGHAPTVQTKRGPVTISDHYGIRVEIT